MSKYTYPKELQELVEVYGIDQPVAEDCLASRNKTEIDTVMKFLRRYGHMINLSSGKEFDYFL